MHTTELAQLSPAERWALVRDGHAIVTDGIVCAIDDLPGERLRLDAHLGSHQDNAVAIEESALWVLGAIPVVPRHVRIAGLDGTRLYVGNGNAYVRELNIDRADCLSFGNRLVTTPARTAADIARHSPDDKTALHDLRALERQTGFASQQALAILRRTVHLPFARRARTRLGAALAHTVGVVDTVDSSNSVEKSFEVTRVAHFKNKPVKG